MNKTNFQVLALAKLIKEFDKELLVKLNDSYFTGHYKSIFKLISHHTQKNGRIPALETVNSLIESNAPKNMKMALVATVLSIQRADITKVSPTEILIGLGDTRTVDILDASLEKLVQSASTRDIGEVNKLLAKMQGDLTKSSVNIQTSREASESIDNTTIIPTGISEALDEQIVGWSGLSCVSAVSGGGKTTFLIQSMIAKRKEGKSVLFVTLELTEKQLLARVASSLTGINFKAIITGNTTEEEQATIAAAMEDFHNLPGDLLIVAEPMSSDEFLTLIATVKTSHDIAIVFLDYINILDIVGGWEELQTLARKLHRQAKQSGVPVVTAVQVEIEKESKNGKPPVIKARGSKELYNSSTLFLFLDNALAESSTDMGIICWSTKNRNAATAGFLLEKNFKVMRFESVMPLEVAE